MIPLSSAVSGRLTWSRTKCSRGCELLCNGEVVGSLEPTSFWSSNILAKCGDESWVFRRCGRLGAGTEIVDAISGQPIAKFKGKWSGGGTLIFPDGQSFEFACKGVWRPVWSVLAADGQPVLRLHVSEKTVELSHESVLPQSRLVLLITLALHRMRQAEEDAAAIAVMSAVMAASAA